MDSPSFSFTFTTEAISKSMHLLMHVKRSTLNDALGEEAAHMAHLMAKGTAGCHATCRTCMSHLGTLECRQRFFFPFLAFEDPPAPKPPMPAPALLRFCVNRRSSGKLTVSANHGLE
mmetsp:Transcript_13171/g.30044  ORF Transcript_13171/g.30044 Transcript_13171/m.30044 type:complete len:117 (-) Transcript_13171:73-423(-)|eukprot:CAMPEP_0181217508 /NCGR_PEP_ID=MMETSP1096-20121128/27187_1 /TAXON_ID=156174 ORGANISM="Chrysochromulina ericina, Strain CCMP281" /NCGR_SAMPLE_ID=MMETSP1096 /ASSEMBLY_ACC=CAM_ASM_000453 /LENGTH=116 /DNA_ID=CAMNT_0023309641 /DNA_START=165 /DNA_END=515 /DNA_ORIENTATION=-